jgi:glycosyltransferase involved in cell wall biosynthesis
MRNQTVVLYTPQMVPSSLPRWLRNIVHFAEIIALKWVDHIIALTPAFKDWMVSEFNLDSAKITPIHVGTATDEIKQFLSQKQGACHQSNMVLCVGSICERKNQLAVVKAISKLIPLHPELRLVFAGPCGEPLYWESIKTYINENGLASYVELKGEVTKFELYDLYSEARMFLFPTTAEIQPTVVMEALTFGLPVVASNIGPNVDVIKHQPNSAILVDPYDVDGISEAVLRIHNDNNLRQKMSLAAEALSETLSYDNVAHETMNLYSRLVQAKKAGREEKR